jgi:hypothetical protein
MGTSIWIKAIRAYLHFLCGFSGLFDMQQKERPLPSNTGPIVVQIEELF